VTWTVTAQSPNASEAGRTPTWVQGLRTTLPVDVHVAQEAQDTKRKIL